MAGVAAIAPQIPISRTTTRSQATTGWTEQSKDSQQNDENFQHPPRINTSYSQYSRRKTHTDSWKHRARSPDVEWHLKWTKDCFPNGRVLLIDYISNEKTGGTGHRRVVAAQEFEKIEQLRAFYADTSRSHQAALRVVHVQNAPWAALFLLRKFNIENPNELVGMGDLGRWVRYQRPRQHNGNPFPNGKTWGVQFDPWRNVSRTGFSMDYLKAYKYAGRPSSWASNMNRPKFFDAKMMHLNGYDDSDNPEGFDVSVQRMTVYVQRCLGQPGRVSPDAEIRNPYRKQDSNGTIESSGLHQHDLIDMDSLDHSNTVIIFETYASLLLQDTLIQARQDLEKRWRRLSFYLKKEDALDDDHMALACTKLIIGDCFHALAASWDSFLYVAVNHVSLLEDKIYENPADESRAPELWTNLRNWLKVEKIMWIHQDLVKEMQGHLKELADLVDNEEMFLNTTLAEFERLAHKVQEDLVQPTTSLSDLMYKSVGIRDSRQSLQLGTSMWRLSWITFIFLPLSFLTGFFGMNVTTFQPVYPDIKWYFVAAFVMMSFVGMSWYFFKYSLARHRQTPYQRGSFEQLFARLGTTHPELWSESGANDQVRPTDFLSSIKWWLLTHWFKPEKTIHAKILDLDADRESGFGVWQRVKRAALRNWLGGLRYERTSTDDAESAELRTAAVPMYTEPGTILELTKYSTPIIAAEAEPSAVQPISSYNLGRLIVGRGREDSPRNSHDRPLSQGSSGIMVEERHLSGDESDTEGDEDTPQPPPK